MSRAISEAAYLVQISGYSTAIFFSGKTGGEKKASTSSYSDGVRRTNKKVVGNYTVEDIELERGFVPEEDPGLIRFFEGYCSRASGDLVITIQPIDNCTQATPIGQPFIYSGVQYLGYAPPEVNGNGDEVSMAKYSFSADDLTI